MTVVQDLESCVGELNVSAALTELQRRVIETRQARVNWQSYLQGQFITEEECDTIKRLDPQTAPPDARRDFFNANGPLCVRVLLRVTAHMSKDSTVEWLLTLLDDLLLAEPARVQLFAGSGATSVLLQLLHRQGPLIQHQASRLICKLTCWAREPPAQKEIVFYISWLRDQISSPSPYSVTAARCLQMIARIPQFRPLLLAPDLLDTIQVTLASEPPPQLAYQLVFVLWSLSFAAAPKLVPLVGSLAKLLVEAQKEKVTRILVALLRNLLEMTDAKGAVEETAVALLQGGALKHLESLSAKRWDDVEVEEDVAAVESALVAAVAAMSSFDEYAAEIKSGRLTWSPVHKQEKFWRENAARLNEHNYELLKVLIRLLESARDPLVLCVATHDLGEYVRYYSFGKNVLETLSGKTAIMGLLGHDDTNVRYYALLSLQKIMVQNWQYLGKQLEPSS